jgi:hypothetical protein
MPISTAKLANAASPIPSFVHQACITKTATISFTSGTALSSAIDLRNPDLFGFTPLILVTPAAWTAAVITAQLSLDGVTWSDMHLLTGEFTTTGTVLANQAHVLSAYPFRGVPFIRFRSGNAAIPVNQAADRVVTVILGTL